MIPGVDDGAKNLEDSIALIKGLRDLGFRKIITTPHVYLDYYPNSSDRLLAGLDSLRQGLRDANVNIDVSCAAEYYMDDFFEDLLDKGDLLTFADNHILVEMSFFSESFKLDEYLFKMQVKGYKPILAHPERYTYYLKNFARLKDLKHRGFKLQLNLLSLTGHYGKEVKDLAVMLLKEDLYDCVGTDTHNMNHISKLKTLALGYNSKATEISYSFLNQKWNN